MAYRSLSTASIRLHNSDPVNTHSPTFRARRLMTSWAMIRSLYHYLNDSPLFGSHLYLIIFLQTRAEWSSTEVDLGSDSTFNSRRCLLSHHELRLPGKLTAQFQIIQLFYKPDCLLIVWFLGRTKYLVGRTNEWVANPIGPGQTSALQIKTRSA